MGINHRYILRCITIFLIVNAYRCIHIFYAKMYRYVYLYNDVRENQLKRYVALSFEKAASPSEVLHSFLIMFRSIVPDRINVWKKKERKVITSTLIISCNSIATIHVCHHIFVLITLCLRIYFMCSLDYCYLELIF